MGMLCSWCSSISVMDPCAAKLESELEEMHSQLKYLMAKTTTVPLDGTGLLDDMQT